MYDKEALVLQLRQLLAAMRRKTTEVENFLKLVEGEEIVNMGDIQAKVSNNILSQVKGNSEHPHYPLHENLIEKFRYFDEVVSRVWLMQEFKDFIYNVETTKAEQTLKNLNQRIAYLIGKGEMFFLKYNNSNKQCFYGAHMDWVERTTDGLRLLTEREPEPRLLGTLSPEQRSPNKIIWKGMFE